MHDKLIHEKEVDIAEYVGVVVLVVMPRDTLTR